MNIQEIKSKLSELEQVPFVLPNGVCIPSHFHVTELGIVTKDFIDCGGTIRQEKVANFQLWTSSDFDHKMHPSKIINIIEIAENSLGLENLEIEVEYQSDTVGKYGLEFKDGKFHLSATQTDCLAKEKCGIPEEPEIIENQTTSCNPSSGCC